MKTESAWFEKYNAAVLETNWTRLKGQIQAAESAIHDRQLGLFVDHGGSLEERDAMANALQGLRLLEEDVWHWKSQQN